ncbi:PREDICTED: uncharacterized protein LOC108684697 [Atta colombica]|uniref:uncharacterized protein LOC108684697 n=1 Tax=Atta colombica TaxID=520822 RepID=UPI00084BD8FB|nr:PREDICTED: uncharacterized protein LOC108684697 [Atta colombica]XP_018044641.1 PREDICTED: uncharacterized protein LOC108684697 [Atta colombica]XP_018044642.1 PREDICTED: uncharacterized protein LOC108684697 [Atta colombica]
MLPINAMAQKVVPGSESGSMKPLTGSGLSYVTLQPPSQPLSLVQDHRPSVYQTPPYIGSNMEKEPEAEKLIPNGVEVTKTETEQDVPAVVKQNESNRNNNLSPETPAQEQPCEMQSEQVLTSLIEFPINTPICTPAQNKVEEKKVPVNNGSKESDGKAVNTSVHIKQSPHKPEDTQTKNDVPKAKPINQSLKVSSDNAAATLTSTYKPDAKVTTSPKTTKRKSRELKDLKVATVVTDGASKPKRNRIQTQPYQSPLPEIALLVKNLNKTPGSKAPDDKLIVFYKNEFLAVRNAEGSFYVCQAMQNIYKSSRRIRIRWLSQDKTNGEFYSPDFYDTIDFDCILTNLNLNKVDKHKFWLTRIELLRTENILKRAIDVEAGVSEKPRVTEEHPDGLDLSLYKDESQLKRRKSLHNEKPNRKKSKRIANSTDDDIDDEESDRNRKTSKASRAKKRSVKALAIAKSVAKGSSRAERALNRSTKSGSSLDNDHVSTTATTTTTAAVAMTNATTAATAVVASAPITAATTTTTVNPATNSAVTDTKNNVEMKKLDLKKNGKQQSNNGTRGFPRTKPGGSAQATQQSSKIAGRPKRVAATTGVVSSEETPSSRKKPRGRA